MAGLVYILCTLTSTLCAWLLLRAYDQRRIRLLLWSGLCFSGLSMHNVLLFADLVVLPQVDLSIPRKLTALAAMAVLIYGLVWEARE